MGSGSRVVIFFAVAQNPNNCSFCFFPSQLYVVLYQMILFYFFVLFVVDMVCNYCLYIKTNQKEEK